MTFLVERLAELDRYVEHLRGLATRVKSPVDLDRDLSLRNDTLFALLMVCQLVIDIAGELSGRHAFGFDDYTGAVRNLGRIPGFPSDLVSQLEKLPGFRNVIIHDYVALDHSRAIAALHQLEPIERFVQVVRQLEQEG